MAELKHVGRIISTKQRCLVAYRTLPGESSSCLVIPTDSLDDAFHNAIINLVEGQSAQDAWEFAELLMRSTFPDGSNMLVWLHQNGRLLKMGTSTIEMTPSPGVSVQLSELNQLIAEQRGLTVDQLAVKPTFDEKQATQAKDAAEVKELAKVEKLDESVKITSASVTPDAVLDSNASPEEQAKFFRSQADKLAKQAAEMRRKAEELVPTQKKVKATA
jgi:hypothetical protein